MMAFAILVGIGYGSGAIGVPATYALACIGLLIGSVGYARWDAREHSRDR